MHARCILCPFIGPLRPLLPLQPVAFSSPDRLRQSRFEPYGRPARQGTNPHQWHGCRINCPVTASSFSFDAYLMRDLGYA